MLAQFGKPKRGVHVGRGQALGRRFFSVCVTTAVVAGVMVVSASVASALALPPKPATPNELFLLAGGGVGPSLGNYGPALGADLSDPTGVAVDSNGDVFFADTDNNMIREISPSGEITNFAGTGVAGYYGDDGPAYNAELNHPEGVAVDANGDVFIADTGNNVIREVVNGEITTIAGNGTAGSIGDDVNPLDAELDAPCGVAVSPTGVIAIADTGNSEVRIVETRFIIDNERSAERSPAERGALRALNDASSRPRFNLPEQTIIYTLAGTGTAKAIFGDGGYAYNATLNYPYGVAFDGVSDLDIADTSNSAVRQVDLDTDIITTLAHVPYPTSLSVDPNDNVDVTSPYQNQIDQIDNRGNVTDIIGTGVQGLSGFGHVAINAEINLPTGVTTDQYGDVFFTDTANELVDEMVVARAPTFSASTPPLVTTAGSSYSYQFNALGVPTPETYAISGNPSWLHISSSTGLVSGTLPGSTLTFSYSVSCTNATGTTTVGPFTVTVPVVTSVKGAVGPVSVVRGPNGAIWFTNFANNSIGEMNTQGLVRTFTAPGISEPFGLTVGPDNALWFTNEGNNSIGRITVAGVVHNFFSPLIKKPFAITKGVGNALWFTNNGNSTIGRITTSGVVSKFSSPYINKPTGITLGPDNALWFTNNGIDSIGRITIGGAVTRFLGVGISHPLGIVTGPDGKLWFTNNGNNSIGTISTAGVVSQFTGVGISSPQAIISGPLGALWFTNLGNNSIDEITPTGTVTQYAESTADGPLGLAVGPDGAIWFANYLGSALGRFTPGSLTLFGDTVLPAGVVLGPDGNMWYTNTNTNSISRVEPNGAVQTFRGPGIDDPLDITVGSDGALWFTNYADNTIGRITTTGVVSYYTGVGIDGPIGITSGSDGALWFTNHTNNTIGRISTGGLVSNYTGIGINGPFDITSGPNGNLWFTNNLGNSIGQIETFGGLVTTFPSLYISHPVDIVTGPDNNLWFTNFSNNSIGRITTSGTVSKFTDSSIKGPEGIAVGADNALWFTNYSGDTIGRVTTSGGVTSWPSPTIDGPVDIATGANYDLWFTNQLGSSIGHITG